MSRFNVFPLVLPSELSGRHRRGVQQQTAHHRRGRHRYRHHHGESVDCRLRVVTDASVTLIGWLLKIELCEDSLVTFSFVLKSYVLRKQS